MRLMRTIYAEAIFKYGSLMEIVFCAENVNLLYFSYLQLLIQKTYFLLLRLYLTKRGIQIV